MATDEPSELCGPSRPYMALGATMSEKKAGFFKRHVNRIALFLISMAIAAACMGLLYSHYRRPDPESLIAAMENRLLDLRFRLRGPRKPSGKIGVLAIDEKSLQKFGRWPFARKNYERVFHNLKTLGVKWVGLDVVWSEPERPLLEDVMSSVTRLGKLSKGNWDEARLELKVINEVAEASLGDRAIGRALVDFKRVVLGYAYYGTKDEGEQLGSEPFRGLKPMVNSAIQGVILPDGIDLRQFFQFNSYGVIANTDYVSAHGEHFAFFNNELSADGIYRWVQLVRNIDGNLMPAMGLKMAAQIMGREPVVFFDPFGITDISLVKPEDDKDLVKIPVDLEGNGRMLINQLGPRQTIPHFSMADIFDMTLTPEQKRHLKGMSLMLGPTALGINDLRANSFDAGFDGVEQHAAVIDNIIAGKFMRRTEQVYATELGLLAGIFVLFAPLMIFGNAVLSAVGAVLFLIGYFFFDKYFWFSRGEWVYMGMPFIEIGALFVSTTLIKYMTEERQRKKIKGAFGVYVSPEVIDQMTTDPEALMRGERKEVTVFFSDVRSFTTISESLSPDKLRELMIEYFTPMTDIVLTSKGTLDKYIGDAIMAFWNAPLDVHDHADRAALASLQMLFALDKLKEELPKKGFPKVDIGIGLNSGMVSVGNMGSPKRASYTVMGDNVNLGSRLEGLTKEYGIKIMISEFTRKKLTRKDLFVRDLDDIRVKGKLEPVKVFELMRPDILRNERDMQSLIGEFEQGRAAYRIKDWAVAKRHFMACLMLRPDDGPATMYLERIEECLSDPHLLDENGVYTFKHK